MYQPVCSLFNPYTPIVIITPVIQSIHHTTCYSSHLSFFYSHHIASLSKQLFKSLIILLLLKPFIILYYLLSTRLPNLLFEPLIILFVIHASNSRHSSYCQFVNTGYSNHSSCYCTCYCSHIDIHHTPALVKPLLQLNYPLFALYSSYNMSLQQFIILPLLLNHYSRLPILTLFLLLFKLDPFQ